MITNKIILIINILYQFSLQISLQFVCNLRMMQREIIGMYSGGLIGKVGYSERRNKPNK
jgi:hypothetical protein